MQSDNPLAQAISARLKSTRTHLRLSQKDVCDRLGFKKATYSDWEQGNRTPSLEAIIAFHREFGLSIYWLLFGQGVEPEFVDRGPTPAEVSQAIGRAAQDANFVMDGQAIQEIFGSIFDGRNETRQERLDAFIVSLRQKGR